MTTFADLLEARRGDPHPGLVEHGRSLTWDEVVHEADRRAAWLDARRTEAPPNVGILLPNGVDYLLWLFGAARAGWAVVGINPTRRGEALAADIRATDCQLVLADAEGRAMLEGLDLGPATEEVHSIDTIVLGEPIEARRAVTEEDLLLLLFTSGTTGTPKAVRCTQGRLAGIAETAGPAYGYRTEDVCYCPMPLFHGNALMALVGPSVLVGATIALRPRFSASAFLDDVRAFGATTFTYVGKAISYLLATDERPDDGDTTLERAFGTEASAADRLRFAERFGCRLVEGYGSSEGGVNIVASPDTPAGALGPAPTGVDLAVVDPETGVERYRAVFDAAGQLLNGTAAIGEIVNRSGGGKFEGYYGDAQAEQSRLRDGWYWTGDLAYRDEAGYFWFAGRSGDWLRVDSENMAATPIESVLARYPGFAGVAVYAVPDVDTAGGDAVMAAVELRGTHGFDPDDLVAWLGRQPDLGTKWAPAFVRITDKLDETATGKITKVRLREEAWHADDPVWFLPARADRYRPLTDADIADLDARLAARART